MLNLLDFLISSIYPICFADIQNNARLADFGSSRQLAGGQTTLHTNTAGQSCWTAKETFGEDGNIRYKPSSDIQVVILLLLFIIIIIRARALHSAKPYCNCSVFSVFRLLPNQSRFWGAKRTRKLTKLCTQVTGGEKFRNLIFAKGGVA